MNNNYPVKSLAWHSNGDIRLILNVKEAPELRIERGSPESIPFSALMMEVSRMRLEKYQNLKDGQSKGRVSKLKNATPAKNRKWLRFRGASSLGPAESNGKSLSEREREEMDRLSQKNGKIKNRLAEKVHTSAPFGGDDMDGPPLEYYENSPEFQNSEPFHLDQTNVPSPAPQKKLNYEKMAQSPANWITDFRLPEPGPRKEATEGFLRTGDYETYPVRLDDKLHRILNDVKEISLEYSNEFKKVQEQKKANANKLVEKSHNLIRWPDGENGQRRFAIDLDGRQVPISCSEQLGEGLVQLMDSGSLEHIVALHDPSAKSLPEISLIKTTHYPSLIPAEEASRMCANEFFPTVYPEQNRAKVIDRPEVAIDEASLQAQSVELEAIGRAYAKQPLDSDQVIHSPVAEVESYDDDEVPEDLLISQADQVEENLENSMEDVPETIPAPMPNLAPEPDPSDAPKPFALPKFANVAVTVVKDGYASNPLEQAEVSSPEM